jgi:hypothetical protein
VLRRPLESDPLALLGGQLLLPAPWRRLAKRPPGFLQNWFPSSGSERNEPRFSGADRASPGFRLSPAPNDDDFPNAARVVLAV